VTVCPTKYFNVIIVEKNGVNSGYATGTYSRRLYISNDTRNKNSIRWHLESLSIVFLRITNYFSCMLSEGIRDGPILIPFRPTDMIALRDNHYNSNYALDVCNESFEWLYRKVKLCHFSPYHNYY
jgi:hypothetical protein